MINEFTVEIKMKRVLSLDYLRGIMAIAVMLYHYMSWASDVPVGGEHLLGKLGIYAVSIFYILSGLSLGIVYSKLSSFYHVRKFFIKRIFRIIPIFWVATSALIALQYISSILSSTNFTLSLSQLILNYSLLFSFVEPTAYMATGSWSIGNEVVFYTIFAFVLYLIKDNKNYFKVFYFIVLFIGLFYAFYMLDRNVSISTQWGTYISPFNQMFLFFSGVAISRFFKRAMYWSRRYVVLGLFLSIGTFVFIPTLGDKIDIVTSWNRITLSLASVLFVLVIYALNPQIEKINSRFLRFLGDSCYSIYLLHPIVAIPIRFLCEKLDISLLFSYLLSGVLTIIISYFTYKYIEKPSMSLAKRITLKVSDELYEPIKSKM